MFLLHAEKNILSVWGRETVTSGSVGVSSVRFEFSEDWSDLEKTAVFKAGARSVSVLLEEDGQCEIPWEVLQTHGLTLFAGVYGTRGSTVVLPTVWTGLGAIREGTALGENAHPPAPGAYGQVLTKLASKADRLDCDGTTLSLLAGDQVLSSVPITSGGSAGEEYLTFCYDNDICQVPIPCAVDETRPYAWLDVWAVMKSESAPFWRYTKMLISTAEKAVSYSVLWEGSTAWYRQGPDSGVFECDADVGMITIGYMP